MNSTLSPYQVSWLILTPVEGKFLKSDLKRLNYRYVWHHFTRLNDYDVGIHFNSREAAELFQSKLFIFGLKKVLTSVIITDKQFGFCLGRFTAAATSHQLLKIKSHHP